MEREDVRKGTFVFMFGSQALYSVMHSSESHPEVIKHPINPQFSPLNC